MQVATAAQQRTGVQLVHDTFLPPKFCPQVRSSEKVELPPTGRLTESGQDGHHCSKTAQAPNLCPGKPCASIIACRNIPTTVALGTVQQL